MTDTTLHETIGELATALSKVNVRLAEISADVDEQMKVRRKFLQESAADYLPDLSEATLRKLRDKLPLYLTHEVLQAFSDYRKVLGIFTRPGTAAVLTLLRTKLASFLDRSMYGKLTEIDQRLSHLGEQRDQLSKSATELANTISLLEKARQNGKNVPQPVLSQLQEWRQTQRVRRPPTSGTASRMVSGPGEASSASSSSYTSSDGDGDLWLYGFTGIPTSLRTWFLSSLTESRHESHSHKIEPGGSTGYDGGGASGDWSAPKNETLAVAAGISTIATDDSLGRFS